VLWGIGLVTALLTAFYMTRQVFMTFYGEPRWKGAGSHGDEAEQSAEEVAEADDATADHDHGGEIHPHESPWTMTFPLIVLAGLSIVGGMLSIPIFERTKTLEYWLHPVVEAGEVPITVASGVKVALAVIATIAALAGIAAGYSLYRRRRFEDQPVAPEILAQGWYYDSSISAFMGGPGRKGFDAVAWFDGSVVDGAVNGTARLVELLGGVVRRLQTGYVRTYAMGVALGAILVVAVITVRGAVL
jgi:NADH-quinone oxidoreductase subunit L